jgi:preprotein translocase subunit SecD
MTRWLKALGLALTLALTACHRDAPTGDTCSIDDAGALDIAGRSDGFYGVVGQQVQPSPLARFEHVQRTGTGVEASSGKRWIGLRLGPEDAQALRQFTADPAGKSIAVIAGGEVASRHKVRVPLETADVQVSCCNPRACDRLQILVPGP